MAQDTLAGRTLELVKAMDEKLQEVESKPQRPRSYSEAAGDSYTSSSSGSPSSLGGHTKTTGADGTYISRR